MLSPSPPQIVYGAGCEVFGYLIHRKTTSVSFYRQSGLVKNYLFEPKYS